VRILRPLSGEVDGQQLNSFQPELMYDVPTSLGTYLLAIAGADVVIDEPEGLVSQLPVKLADEPHAARGRYNPGVAADRSSPRTRRPGPTAAIRSRKPRRVFARRSAK
jgi:hypothetical protein